MRIDPIEYGKALFLLTEESGISDTVNAELSVVGQALKENPDYRKILDTPAIPTEEKCALLDAAFSKVHPYLLNFLKIVAERRSFCLFDAAAASFSACFDESRGIERVEALTAIPLTKEQERKMTEKLEKMLGKTVLLHNTTDPSLLGGVCLRTSTTQTDGTLRARLSAMEAAIQKTIV